MFGSPAGATFGGYASLRSASPGCSSRWRRSSSAQVPRRRARTREHQVTALLPTTRGQAFAGKVVGRAAVLVFGLGVGLVVGLGFGSALLGELEVVALVLFVLATLFFAAVYASIVVGISATTVRRRVRRRWHFLPLVFELLWDVVPMGILYVVEGFSFPSTIRTGCSSSRSSRRPRRISRRSSRCCPTSRRRSARTRRRREPRNEVAAADAEPFYASPEVGIVVLFLWFVVPFAVGYYRFKGPISDRCFSIVQYRETAYHSRLAIWRAVARAVSANRVVSRDPTLREG